MIIYNNFPRAETILVEPSRIVMSCGRGKFHIVRFVLESRHRNLGNKRESLRCLNVTTMNEKEKIFLPGNGPIAPYHDSLECSLQQPF